MSRPVCLFIDFEGAGRVNLARRGEQDARGSWVSHNLLDWDTTVEDMSIGLHVDEADGEHSNVIQLNLSCSHVETRDGSDAYHIHQYARLTPQGVRALREALDYMLRFVEAQQCEPPEAEEPGA
jgi:hypothetical protein